jgi:hypothetical protein
MALVYLHVDATYRLTSVKMGEPAAVSISLYRNITHFHFRNIDMENITPLRCQRTFVGNVEQLKEVRLVRMSSSLRYCLCAVV